MNSISDHSIYTESPRTKYHLGKRLFECLQKKNKADIISIFAPTGVILTCGRILEDSIKATAVLKELGLEKGDVVSVVMENSLCYYMVLLASLYMGVTINPLNPNYLTAELKHALVISKPKVVISSDTAVELLVSLKEELKFIKELVLLGSETESNSIRRFEDLMKRVTVDIDSFIPEEVDFANHHLFILLSSGTTGLPKGVPLTSQNIEATLNCFLNEDYVGLSPKDATVFVLPVFHIFGLLILLSGIVGSTKLIMLKKFEPDVFLGSVEKHRATKLFFVPSLLLFLARSTLVQNYDISSVNMIVVGGASTSKKLKDEVKEKFKSINICELYGSTEAGGICAYESSQVRNTDAVGELLPGLKCMVWDNSLKRSVGPLQTGELCFKGPMIAKGYICGEVPTERCLDKDGFWHSGDLGYLDKQGYLYVVDRIKELIKYKGFQVPPAELEALIMTNPKVKECGVIGIPDEKCGQLPLACVVVNDGTKVTEQELIDYVAERISIQKRLYGGVIFVNEIPKSVSGKILHKKLMDMYKDF